MFQRSRAWLLFCALAAAAIVSISTVLPSQHPAVTSLPAITPTGYLHGLQQAALFGPAFVESTTGNNALAVNNTAATRTWFVTVQNLGTQPVTIDRGGITADQFTVNPGESGSAVYDVAQYQAIRWTSPAGSLAQLVWVIR